MANEKVTQLPTVGSATLGDIVYAVQGGTSVQQTLQQVSNLIFSQVITSFAGNPNGNVAGVLNQLCWNSTGEILYVCTSSGSSSTAVWTASSRSSFPYIVGQDTTKYFYNTVQSAITAAAVTATAANPAIVYITPGIYNENVTLSPYVFLNGINGTVTATNILPAYISKATVINGNTTLNFAAQEIFQAIGIQFTTPNSSPAINITSSNNGSYVFNECQIDGGISGTAVRSTAPNPTITFNNSILTAQSTAKIWNITSTQIVLNNCVTSNGGANSTLQNSAELIANGGQIYDSFNLTTSASVSLYNCNAGAASTNEPFNLIDSNTLVIVNNSSVNSNASSTYWIKGIGTLQAAGVILNGNSRHIDPGIIIQNLAATMCLGNLSFNGGANTLNTAGQIISVPFSSSQPSVMQMTSGSGIILDFTAPNAKVSMLPATQINSGSALMQPNHSYIANDGSSPVTFELPVTIKQGDLLEVCGKGGGGWTLIQQTGQIVHIGNTSTTISSGSVSSTNQYDDLILKCITDNTEFKMISSVTSGFIIT